ncbi:hypothetical protein [Mesorhizobium sp.]|uniref:hypothetical protein n=1 Tax=Mesorhizobium sp. TaxID=1871066 RepID=UPI000FE9C188|nr:hypothetical protein [Mesorhizobium sp.]RWE78105.1 MAG: hypothetical protein EOS42_06145 [Mesorhizobium sp.]TIV30355.1 MAG: hypothetical protein E5V90_08685 [Mesorhizobium sp.]
MVRRNKPKQLSEPQIAEFMAAAAALHKAIVSPLVSTQCDHYRSMQDLHEALLKTVKDVTGKDAASIKRFGAGSK